MTTRKKGPSPDGIDNLLRELSENESVGVMSRRKQQSAFVQVSEDTEQLRYAPPHWSGTGYYGMGRYWISLLHSSSTHTHCGYFKQPALHLRSVGASCPSLPSELDHSHISTG
ncbi:hypothetical protein TNCV_4663801 [Trichonephila clavipes]|uniref:Uncharacterized protein n=1 Tax=Trichonephila clavipes TaxID=2585209 RepID=A0A8X6SD60_TRICX|nr:hypothetical protein TNCV_4663801 [Trichonephila clavipes]